MKNISVILGVAALVSVLPATPALADPNENAATIDKDLGCVLTVLPGLNLNTTDMVQVNTKSGVTTLTCHFDIDEEDVPDTVLRASGFSCGTSYGVTAKSKAIATPGGNAVLICKINSGAGS